MLITPPPVWPNSAEKFDVCTVNSFTVSGENVTTARPRPTPVFRAPSARIAVLPARPPLTKRLNPGVGISEPISGSSVPAAPTTLPTVNARSRTLRLLSGISTIWRSVIVCPGVPDPRLMSGASAATITSVDTSPSASVSFSVAVVAVSTFTRSTTATLKPGNPAVTRYSTGSSSGAENAPRLGRLQRDRVRGADIGNRDRRAGDHGSRLIEDGPVDRSLAGLSRGDDGREEKQHGREQADPLHDASW